MSVINRPIIESVDWKNPVFKDGQTCYWVEYRNTNTLPNGSVLPNFKSLVADFGIRNSQGDIIRPKR